MLGLHFVKTGILEGKFGTLYGQLFSLRQTGDYGDTFGLTKEQVFPLVQQTEDLIDVVSDLIKKQQE
jgi:uncharacterized protein (UPF0332 family)